QDRSLHRPARRAVRRSRASCGAGHAAEEPPRPADAQEVEGVPRPRPSALGAATRSPRHRTRPLPQRLTRNERHVPKPPESIKNAPLVITTGRRKAAIARVWLRPGSGTITINTRPVDNYFPAATQRQLLTEPLRVTDTAEVYDVFATITGGGTTGQAGA